MTTDRPVIREIITKAVCGKGSYRYQRSIDLEIPESQKTVQVLGNFVSNAALDEAQVVDSTKYGKSVQVKGHYDVHVWYANDQDTRAAKTTVMFIEYIPMKMYGGENITGEKALAKIIHKPHCNKAHVKNLGDKTVIRVEIEQNLAAEIIGSTKLKVGISPAVITGSGSVSGQELLPPPAFASQPLSAPFNAAMNAAMNVAMNAPLASPQNYCFDQKYDEDLPEEDDEYFEYSPDEFDN